MYEKTRAVTEDERFVVNTNHLTKEETNMSHKMLKLVSFFCCSAVLILAGCGSDSSSPTGPQTNYLVGSLIEGMPYTCGSTSSRTGRVGQFTHLAGDSCTFKLGKNSFTVGPDKLQRGFITAYDLTSTQQQAWTLMAIIDAISHRRPNSDLLLIIDSNLEKRIPVVDLSKGDTAVTEALATFNGTVQKVSVADARTRLGKTLTEDNKMALTREELIAQGKQILDSLGLHIESGKVWEGTAAKAGSTAVKSVTVHTNKVNLRFYDNQGNPVIVNQNDNNSWHTPGNSNPNLWVTSGQNPNNSTPHLGVGSDYTDISGGNILGIYLDVGRSDSTDVANSFYSYAYWGNSAGSPVSIFAHGAKTDEATSTGFPQQLNFGFMTGMYTSTFSWQPIANYSAFAGFGGGYYTGIYCQDLMFGQGSTKASFSKWLDAFKSLKELINDTTEAVSEEGENIEADAKVAKSFVTFIKDLVDLATQNWWVATVATNTPSARITINGQPGLLTRCYPTWTSVKSGTDLNYTIDWNNPMPLVISSTQDDHTFDIRVAFPGQKLYGVTLPN